MQPFSVLCDGIIATIHRARQIMLGVLDGTMRLYENFNHNGLLAVHLIEEVYYAC